MAGGVGDVGRIKITAELALKSYTVHYTDPRQVIGGRSEWKRRKEHKVNK